MVQQRRFEERLKNPIKRWKFSEMDLLSRHKWNEYSKAKDEMLSHTDTEFSPWYIVNSDKKRATRLNCISHLLSMLPYKELNYPEITLDKVEPPEIERPPMQSLRFVKEVY